MPESKEGGKKKPTFYLWWTNNEAGIADNYTECQASYSGKAGGRNKKFNSKEEAEEALQIKLNAIREAKEGQEINEDSEINETQRTDPALTHDDRYEEFEKFKSTQTELNNKIEESYADLCKEFNDLKVAYSNTEKAFSEKLQIIREEFDTRVNGIKTDFQKSYDKKLYDQNKRISRLEARLKQAEGDLKKAESHIIEVVEGNTDHSDGDYSSSEEEECYDVDESAQINVETSNSFRTLGNDQEKAEGENAIEATERSTDRQSNPSPRSQNEVPNAGEHTVRSNPQTNSKGSILILTDSMLRGIRQRKLSPNSYVNKQYIAGGTQDMIHYLSTMRDETNYESIIIHTGTNDVLQKPLEDINSNIETIITAVQSRWENAYILVSGIILHKNDLTKNDLIDIVNKNTKDLCTKFDNVAYMENICITTMRNGNIDERAYYDDLHLNNTIGTKRLAANIKDHLGIRSNRPTEPRRIMNNRPQESRIRQGQPDIAYRRPQEPWQGQGQNMAYRRPQEPRSGQGQDRSHHRSGAQEPRSGEGPYRRPQDPWTNMSYRRHQEPKPRHEHWNASNSNYSNNFTGHNGLVETIKPALLNLLHSLESLESRF